jgi:hypothetical protein
LATLKRSASFLIEIFSCSLTSIIFFLKSSEYGRIDDFPLNSFTLLTVPHSCEKGYNIRNLQDINRVLNRKLQDTQKYLSQQIKNIRPLAK